MPRVSVCISVLNQPEMLRDTIKTVTDQTYQDWECIVVDDGSTVPIAPIVWEFNDERITYHRFDQNRGIPHGANYAYSFATGDYIQAMGCDERLSPQKFEEQVKYLEEHPEIDLLWGVPGNGPYGPVPSWEQYVRKAHNRSKELWLKCFLLLEGVPVGGGSALWRRKLFDSIGYFDPNLTAFSDHEWFCRVIEKHNVKILPYRWMTEIEGFKSVCTRTPQNASKLDWELRYVREKHPLQLPPVEGKVTVAIPVYNHAKYLAEAIQCVLDQTVTDLEILVMDDGSTEDVESVVKTFTDPRIQFFRSEKNEGHMATVNKLLEKATGTFFVSCSADDRTEPNLFEKLLAEFKSDPFLEHVASQNDFITEDGKPFEGDHPMKNIQKASNRSVEDWWNTFRVGNVYFGMGMYRTSALRDVGGWDPSHGVISDYEMYLRLIPRYNFRIVEEPLTHTRIHGKNQSLLNQEEAKKLKRRYFNAQKPYYPPRPKVIIATPFYELKAFSPYVRSILDTTKLLMLHGIEWEFMDLSGDSYVHRARNSMCMTFLDDPYATDLFFIDSDMAWDPHAFIGMMFRPEPVLGGSYPVKNRWDMWTSKPRIVDPEKDPHFVGIPLPDGSALIEGHQLAGGFLRIKRSVLEKYVEFYPLNSYKDTHPDPAMQTKQVEFFATGIDREPDLLLLKDIEAKMKEGPVDLSEFKERFEKLKEPRDFVGEDYCFSNRLRNMGIQIFIYPNVNISHFGVQGWTGNFNSFLNAASEKKKETVQKAFTG